MIKRLFDVLLSSFGLLIFSPVLIYITYAVRNEDGGPVFYRGERVGKDGKLFKIYKFRTMVVNADKLGGPSTSDNDNRITATGRFLRKYKFDELPQLINVLKGEMSFVGPRPEVKRYTDMYTFQEKGILTLRPGITDWASLANSDEGAVLARYADSDKAYEEVIRPEKIRLQLKYLNERSFLNDLYIISQTVKAVFIK